MTIGDMICWQAAIGLPFHAGAPGFREMIKSPRTLGKHPITGWPVSTFQQHEDFLLTSQGGMPLPFDYGVMRFACLSPMVTNWMGDRGFLNSLYMKLVAPILYGDATWYQGEIFERTDYDDSISLKLKIIGKNQLGETTTEAEAALTLPREGVLSVYYRNRSGDKNIEKKAPDSFKTAIDLFEIQAARHPDAFDLIFGETRLTYKEVNCQADRMARKLLSLGVMANTTVAVCMDRSHHFIIAVFGILKAGAAYVPMDTLTPQKRLVDMCDDCRADVLIVDDSGARVLEGYPGKIVFMDSLLEDTSGSSQPHCDRKMNKEDLAYIMFTSASIGKAKGVAVTQGNLSSYLLGLKPTLGVNVGDIYLHSASFAFSASVRQIFLPLCSGASLVIADTEQRWDPIATASLIQREGVTHWDTVPSFLRLCCDTFLKLDSIKSRELLNNKLKRILVTGEPLMWEVPFLWNQTLKHSAKIINLYSQTETSGTVCLYEVPPNSATVKGVVPIGFPIPDTAVYLLDENLRPVSYGEVGEICVAGPRVSKGYLNLPELTAGHFIDNPFCAGSEFKLFRTGDLGLYLPDGVIMTKGRRDRRVKIRGFRIELEEIEKALRTHPGIRQAVTVASDGNGREAQLLAYFVSKGETTPAQGELRTFVQAILPDYMLPAHFLLLEELPLNPNGKVNYSALPLPDGTRPEISSTFVTPRTSVEKALAAVWSDILGLDNVGIHDNFFELGGNSLSATRMLFKVRHLFQIEVPLRSIFETPTVEGLSLFITQSFMGNQSSDESLNIINELEDMSDEEAIRLLEKESGSMNTGYTGHY